MKFDFALEDEFVRLTVQPEKRGWLSGFKKGRPADLLSLPKEELPAALALVKIRQLDPVGNSHTISKGQLTIRHALVAAVDANSAAALGLPRTLQGLNFRARLKGTVGSPDFAIEWWWEQGGRNVYRPLKGAFVGPPTDLMRLPHQIYEAIKIADEIGNPGSITEHWLLLGRFRRLFEADPKTDDKASLEGFLKDISVVTCSSVGIKFDHDDDTRFFPVPYSSDVPGSDPNNESAEEALSGQELTEFRESVLRRGAQPAFRVADGKFLIVEPSAAPIVQTIVDHALKSEEGRNEFIANAGRIIAEAVELQMMRDGRLTELMSPEARAEKLEEETSRVWVETPEWISRVVGVGKWQKLEIDGIHGSGTRWLPESETELADLLALIQDEDLGRVLEELKEAQAAGYPSINLEIGAVPVTPVVIEVLSRRLAEFLRAKGPEESSVSLDAYLPVTHDNFWELDFSAALRDRDAGLSEALPPAIETPLQPHQVKSFEWQVKAWKAGLPGILNADEQGLGKTLQTLSLLAWLKTHMVAGALPNRPFLIVAPTSLLLNWEAEIERHLESGFLGKPIRLYGDHLNVFKREDASGQDIRTGASQVDLEKLTASENGSPIVITTYQTLANYAISLMDVRWAAVVFDEIQNLKNPVTMRAKAAKSITADLRIGLTGTPLENATKDIWAIMDQLFPGALGVLAQFRRIFDKPTEDGMTALHSALFKSQHGRPALALRRLKTDAAPGLPSKVRVFHPREMPATQALRYEEARHKGGIMLAVLQHIRRLSLHPGLLEGETIEEFNASSARLSAAIDVLRHIKAKNERALVFIENRDVQAWFAEVVRIEFGLERVMIINGDNTVDSRKDITDRFQRHLVDDKGFDVLVLGPRAAGTGLTLTAANHVIHLTRWWNPAVEEQCNDRTHRIGQTKPVTVHIPLAVHPKLGAGSFDCLLQRLMKRKRSLAERILWPAEATENETKLLYDAVVSAEKMPEEKFGGLKALFEGRDDLETEMISSECIRVRLRQGGASVVVSAEDIQPQLRPEANGDAVFISMKDLAKRGSNDIVPHSRLSSTALWPDYILPQ
ncbi:DEAD/DEAH box helicase [Rhizobium ruizarguesonis]|uniref:DEAD/DEAH box helicase n=1 Tax=Rhizobium ruizarguesonis TaxID=2081791 RepID=UPI0010325EDB|nr:DEAD/DEAH box helicase [Rhizobium ruizarguesonis]TAW77459.1 DEAD/DEAH box helicase [Rhizobium ruizarguesonis]TAX14425.1 DEAD/DEAH box helicase [Rhizobium ruizarguesonis]TAX19256.1 DEAD/DEAH box helicase [Rhizobium ruizarguesonis]